MQQGGTPRHHPEESRFLVESPLLQPFRETSQIQSFHFLDGFSICRNMTQQHMLMSQIKISWKKRSPHESSTEKDHPEMFLRFLRNKSLVSRVYQSFPTIHSGQEQSGSPPA